MERAVTYVCKFVSVAAHSDVLHQYLRRDLCNTILKMKKIIYDFRVTPPLRSVQQRGLSIAAEGTQVAVL